MEADALRLGTPNFLTEGEAKAATITGDALVDRPWDLWRKRAGG